MRGTRRSANLDSLEDTTNYRGSKTRSKKSKGIQSNQAPVSMTSCSTEPTNRILSADPVQSKEKQGARDDGRTKFDRLHHIIQEAFVLPDDCLEGSEITASSSFQPSTFVKLNITGEEDSDVNKIFNNDINYIFSNDKSKFIGDFKTAKCKITRGYLTCSRDLRLYYTKVEPLITKLASIALIHGVFEHSARFLDLAEYFAKNGFVVHLIDMRGFGFSGGHRGLAEISELHEDIKLLLKQANKELPLFIYGDCMGASLLTSLLMRNKWLNISGVILTSPIFGFAPEQKMDMFTRWLVRLAPNCFNEMMLSSRVDITSLTKDNYQINKMIDDQLIWPYVTLKTAKNLIALLDFIKSRAYKFRYPVLIVHGSEDKVANFRNSVTFHNKISSPDKTIQIFKQGFHMLHHDTEKDQLKQLVLNWMRARISKDMTSSKLGIIENLKLGINKKILKTSHKALLVIFVLIYFIFLRK